MSSKQFSLCWDNFHRNMTLGMQSLLEKEDLVDVTLAIEGRYLKAHKMVLSVCSPYFRELFQSNPCQHPIVFMRDVSYVVLMDLLKFMYQGEVQVAPENLSLFIKTAKALDIKGLTSDYEGQNRVKRKETDTVTAQPIKHTHDQELERTSTNRVQTFAGPASNKPKLFPSVTPTPFKQTPVASSVSKFDVKSVTPNNAEAMDDLVVVKQEPTEPATAIIDQSGSETMHDSTIKQYAELVYADDITEEGESIVDIVKDEKADTSTDTGGASDTKRLHRTVAQQNRRQRKNRRRVRLNLGGGNYVRMLRTQAISLNLITAKPEDENQRFPFLHQQSDISTPPNQHPGPAPPKVQPSPVTTAPGATKLCIPNFENFKNNIELKP